MRTALPLLLALGLAAGLCSCDAAESGGDGPACGGGFAEERYDRYGHDPEAECYLMYFFSGVVVELPALSPERSWVLAGTVGDEAFSCTLVPGMVPGDRCDEHPGVVWSGGSVLLYAHPCHLSLRLERDGAPVATADVEPAYEWSEPNGIGCGWVGEATVTLVPDEA